MDSLSTGANPALAEFPPETEAVDGSATGGEQRNAQLRRTELVDIGNLPKTKKARLGSVHSVSALNQVAPMNKAALIRLDNGSWLCGICRRASFVGFDEACMHEVLCKMFEHRPHNGVALQALFQAGSAVPTGSGNALLKSGQKLRAIAAVRPLPVSMPLPFAVPRPPHSRFGQALVEPTHAQMAIPMPMPPMPMLIPMPMPMPVTVPPAKHSILLPCQHGNKPLTGSAAVTGVDLDRTIDTDGHEHLQREEELEPELDANREFSKPSIELAIEDSGSLIKPETSWTEATVDPGEAADEKELSPALIATAPESVDLVTCKGQDEIVPQTGCGVAKKRYSGKPETIDVSSFVPGKVDNFWECKHCSAIPSAWRVSGSVVFSATPPTLEIVKTHLEKCQGLDSLVVPRTAQVSVGYAEELSSIRITWDKTSLDKMAGKIERKRAAGVDGEHSSEERKQVGAILLSGGINVGVESLRLAVEEDRGLTSGFAYATVSYLRKCYLAHAGGSRGRIPLGYPGLACCFCAGHPSERRFFYTSSAHLRNSFAHIPSHIMACPFTPTEVRRKLVSLKAKRKQDTSLLQPGTHKVFLEKVWRRTHSSGDVCSDCFNDSDEGSYCDESIMSMDSCEIHGSISKISEKGCTERMRRQCSNAPTKVSKGSRVLTRRSNKVIPAASSSACSNIQFEAIDFASPSKLVKEDERRITSDFAYFCLLQCDIYNLEKGSTFGQVGLPVLCCKHCRGHDTSGKLFLPRSATHLRNVIISVGTHLTSCSTFPHSGLTNLEATRKVKLEQEAELKRGMHMRFCEKVWCRLMEYDLSIREEIHVEPLPPSATHVVTENDRGAISEYHLFFMKQMIPAVMDGNETSTGSRSTFPSFWPGLACRHCHGQPGGGRKMFHRNADILQGNAAHIPNHLMSCPSVPSSIKSELAEKKARHTRKRMDRGASKAFYRRVWQRLVLYSEQKKKEKEQEQEEQR